MSTYELIVATLAGDQRAAGQLVAILSPIFQREAQYAVYRIRGSREDVKDLVGDIFADLFDRGAMRLRRFDPQKGATPEGYFRRFARLRCMGYARDESDRLLELLMAPADLSELQTGAHPEPGQLAALDAKSKLQRIAEVLPAADYDLLVRRYLKGQETREICAALNLSQDVYFQRIHRLITRLKQHGLLEQEYCGRKPGKGADKPTDKTPPDTEKDS